MQKIIFAIELVPDSDFPMILEIANDEMEKLELALAKIHINAFETADAEIAAAGIDLSYEVGTMIEIPRAALTADEIAKEAEFFSFGTNDLTQMTFGYSRDDAEGKFLNRYVEQKILPSNPFETLDTKGVGALIEMSMEKGKSVSSALVGGKYALAHAIRSP